MAAQNITKEVKKLQRAAKRRTVPQSWRKAAGLLRNKKVDPLEHQERLRSEWGER